MCGLVGVAGIVGVKEESVFHDLLVMDAVRGPHSTGVYGIGPHGNKEGVLLKEEGSTYPFLEQWGERLLGKWSGSWRLLLGHNRWATMGVINRYNAHPFEFETVVGAHNGTLVNQKLLPDHKMFDVDSENIYHSIDTLGIDYTHERLDGAYALSYYDKVDQSLNFVRNGQRSLSYCFSTDKKTMYWASEKEMLELCLRRNNVRFSPVEHFEPYHLHKVSLQVEGYPAKILEIEKRRLKEFKAPPVKKHRGGAGGKKKKILALAPPNSKVPFASLDDSFAALQSLLHTEIVFEVGQVMEGATTYVSCTADRNPDADIRWYLVDSDDKGDILNNGPYTGKIKSIRSRGNACYATLDRRSISSYIPEDDGNVLLEGYNSTFLTVKAWNAATAGGCAWCSDPVFVEDAATLVWASPKDFVCSACASMPDVSQYLHS